MGLSPVPAQIMQEWSGVLGHPAGALELFVGIGEPPAPMLELGPRTLFRDVIVSVIAEMMK